MIVDSSKAIRIMGKPNEICSSAIARLFSPNVLGEIARKGRSSLFARLLHESNLIQQVPQTVKLYNLFEKAFEFLKCKEHRHEYSYKAALANQLFLGEHSLDTASMITELRVGRCRADVVILNATSMVYEIKSERDSLDRLSKQINTFQQVFAHVNVIVGENHILTVLDSVGQDIGVMILTDEHQIKPIQKGRAQASKIHPVSIFDTIRLRESELILNDMGISVPDVPNTLRYQALRSCFTNLDPVRVHDHMVRTLKQTRCLKSRESLLKQLPSCLHSAVLSLRLRQQDYTRLVESLKTSISTAITWS